MTIQWSTTLRNARLSAIPTTLGASAIIRIYSGTEPANVAAALSGNTLLAEFDLASSWSTTPSAGSFGLSSLPLTVNASASGIASFYRMFASDGATCHEQGSVTVSGAGGDLTLDNTNIASGQEVQIVSFTKTEPGA